MGDTRLALGEGRSHGAPGRRQDSAGTGTLRGLHGGSESQRSPRRGLFRGSSGGRQRRLRRPQLLQI